MHNKNVMAFALWCALIFNNLIVQSQLFLLSSFPYRVCLKSFCECNLNLFKLSLEVCWPAYEIIVHSSMCSEGCAVNRSNWSVLFGLAGLVPW